MQDIQTLYSMKLQLKKFDMHKLKDDSVVLFIGKRNTGKSVLVRDVMYHHQNLPIGVVISPTEKANKFFEKFVPDMMIYDDFDPALVQKVLQRQEKMMKEHDSELSKYGKTDLDPRCFLIMDDCLYDKTWPADKNIRFLFMNGRHYKVFFMITMQYPLGIPPHLRANVDYVFIFRENQIKQRERIYQQYAGMFSSFDVFNQVLDQVTEDYECMVIDNKVQSNKLTDQVFWYKASLHESFKTCSPDLWHLCTMDKERQQLGLSKEPDGDPEYDPKVHKKSKNMPTITVQKNYERY